MSLLQFACISGGLDTELCTRSQFPIYQLLPLLLELFRQKLHREVLQKVDFFALGRVVVVLTLVENVRAMGQLRGQARIEKFILVVRRVVVCVVGEGHQG